MARAGRLLAAGHCWPERVRVLSLQHLKDTSLTINYKWRYDTKYYAAAVVDRYYRQLPFILHLPSQFTILWILGILAFSWITGETLGEFGRRALLIGAELEADA
jgi:hypothetical protein